MKNHVNIKTLQRIRRCLNQDDLRPSQSSRIKEGEALGDTVSDEGRRGHSGSRRVHVGRSDGPPTEIGGAYR